jgi:hypothetical protein
MLIFIGKGRKMKRKMKLSLVVAALLGLLAVFGSAEGSDANLVAHWMLDEGTGSIAYDSAGDNDGSINGPNWTTGQIDGALAFDGVNDYVSFGTGPAITGTVPFAVSAWVKTDVTKGQGIVTQRSTTTGNGMYGMGIISDGRVQLQIYNGGYGFVVRSDITVSDGLWHHVAGVRTNSTDGEVYVDGSLSGTDSGPARSLNNVPVWIGRGFTGPFYFDGEIDEVMIFNRALSGEEVEQLYWEGFSDLELAVMQIEDALAEKEAVLDGIGAALEEEWAAYDSLEELLASGDYGDLTKHDIAVAQRKIESAIRRQERSKRVVQGSIEELEDALLSLGWEPEPEPEPNEPSIPVPAKLLKGARGRR